METHLFNMTLLKSVGEISDKKINQLVQAGYEILETSDEGFAKFKIPDNSCSLFISEGQITLAEIDNESNGCLQDPEVVYGLFSQILDTLLLDDEYYIKISVEKSYPGTDVFKKANALFSEELLFSGAFAVGSRIAFKREAIHGEVKIEPFYKEPSRYYLSFDITSNEKNGDGNAVSVIREGINLITNEIEPLARKIFE